MKPSIRDIEWAVCARFKVESATIRGPQRGNKKVFRPRHVAMFLAREMNGASFPKIGIYFGGRDHTTIISACRRVRFLMAEYPKFAEMVQECREGVPTEAREASERVNIERLHRGEICWVRDQPGKQMSEEFA